MRSSKSNLVICTHFPPQGEARLFSRPANSGAALLIIPQLKQILRVSEEGEVLGTVTDAVREANLFHLADEPASHSGDAMSSAVQHSDSDGKPYAGKRSSRGDPSLGNGDGGSVRINKQTRRQLENQQEEAEQQLENQQEEAITMASASSSKWKCWTQHSMQ